MPDISMCSGGTCPLRLECFRHRARPSSWQSWYSEPPVKEDGTCRSFMKLWDVTSDRLRPIDECLKASP